MNFFFANQNIRCLLQQEFFKILMHIFLNCWSMSSSSDFYFFFSSCLVRPVFLSLYLTVSLCFSAFQLFCLLIFIFVFLSFWLFVLKILLDSSCNNAMISLVVRHVVTSCYNQNSSSWF